MYSPSSGERTGRSPNQHDLMVVQPLSWWGCTTDRASRARIVRRVRNHHCSRTLLERVARDGESPVGERVMARWAGS